jgi:hypothetical protein
MSLKSRHSYMPNFMSADLHERRNKMTMPRFTAEASLQNTKQHYVLASAAAAEAGIVLPQGLFVAGNLHLFYCDEIVGCIDLGYRGPSYLM